MGLKRLYFILLFFCYCIVNENVFWVLSMKDQVEYSDLIATGSSDRRLGKKLTESGWKSG